MAMRLLLGCCCIVAAASASSLRGTMLRWHRKIAWGVTSLSLRAGSETSPDVRRLAAAESARVPVVMAHFLQKSMCSMPEECNGPIERRNRG